MCVRVRVRVPADLLSRERDFEISIIEEQCAEEGTVGREGNIDVPINELNEFKSWMTLSYWMQCCTSSSVSERRGITNINEGQPQSEKICGLRVAAQDLLDKHEAIQGPACPRQEQSISHRSNSMSHQANNRSSTCDDARCEIVEGQANVEAGPFGWFAGKHACLVAGMYLDGLYHITAKPKNWGCRAGVI